MTTHRLDRRAIIFAEVGNRLEVGCQPPGQPHQLDITLRFAFKPSARLHAIEVAIEVNLPQRRGMIGRPARHRRRHSRKPQGGKVQFVDEDLNHPNRVLLADVARDFIGLPRIAAPEQYIPDLPAYGEPAAEPPTAAQILLYKGKAPGRGNSYVERYEEDYSYLRDPRLSTDFFDPLKFIPL